MTLGFSKTDMCIHQSDIDECVCHARERLKKSDHEAADIESFTINLMRTWAHKHGQKPTGILASPDVSEAERISFIESENFWQSARHLNIHSPIELFFYIVGTGFDADTNKAGYTVIECTASLIVFSAAQNTHALFPSILKANSMLLKASLEAKKHTAADMTPKYISALKKEKSLKQNAQTQKKKADNSHGDKIRMTASALLQEGVSQSDLVRKTWIRLKNQHGIKVSDRTVRRHIEKMTTR